MVGFALPLKGYTHPTTTCLPVILRRLLNEVGARHAVPLLDFVKGRNDTEENHIKKSPPFQEGGALSTLV